MNAHILRDRFDWTSDESPAAWLQEYRNGLSEVNRQRLDQIYQYLQVAYPVHATSSVGEPLMRYLLRTAQMVAQMDLLADAVLATLCLSLPIYTPDWREKIQLELGAQVLSLVEGVDQVQKLTEFVRFDALLEEEKNQQAETMRKMLLAMVTDIRVVLIALAMRTRTMQYLGRLPDSEQKRTLAKETKDVFAPLANRLGVWQLKWQLEDLAFRYLQPEEYREIAEHLDGKRNERLIYIEQFSTILKKHLQAAGLHCDIAGRPKHIYSIYKKMQRKKRSFHELYDIRAVRVLVNTIPECYAALGVVHSQWQPISGEFDDYIAQPKANDYRSLHTVVVGPQNKGIEIQIRTFEMHEFAEFGVAAHWRYKEGGEGDSAYEQKIAWLRQLLDWRENLAESSEEDLAEAFKTELFKGTIYVLTPQGKVLSLPNGATPIDFAYALHTDLGHRCRGAKVNGHIVPLSTALKTGQRVEILVAKNGHPSVDWLHEGWVKSPKAISKIRAYVRQQNRESVKEYGKTIVDKALSKQDIRPSVQKLVDYFQFNKVEDLHIAVGQGDIGIKVIQRAIEKLLPTPQKDEKQIHVQAARADKQDKNGILINGQGGLLTVLAKCCKPAPPDEIIGFVTRDRGISVHRMGCHSFEHLANLHPEKIQPASWAVLSTAQVFAIDIEIQAHDRSGLLRDISELFLRHKVNVTAVQTHKRDDMSILNFTIEVKQVVELPKIINDISMVDDVLGVRRL